MARPRKSKTSSECVVCKNTFELTVRQAAHKRKTCSSACNSILRGRVRQGIKRPGVGGQKRASVMYKNCLVCEQIFYLSSQQASDNKKTCSNKCKGLLISRSKGGLGTGVCENCGKEYEISRYHLTKKRRFCSENCRKPWLLEFNSRMTGENNPFWNGGRGECYYGPSWQQARRDARNRDNSTCQSCSKTAFDLGEQPIVHHIIPFKTFGVEKHEEANQINNLICLCKSCHLKVHWNEIGRSGIQKTVRVST